MLPPSVGSSLANFAAAFAGKVSVNLNYTSGPAGLESAVRQAGLRTVITSQEFLDKAGVSLPEGLEPPNFSYAASASLAIFRLIVDARSRLSLDAAPLCSIQRRERSGKHTEETETPDAWVSTGSRRPIPEVGKPS